MNWMDKINETTDYIKSKVDFSPTLGIILGTGLGNLIQDIDVKFELPYDTIPNFPVSTVESHKGKLIFGVLENKNVVVMQGRFHYYEGYDMKEVTFPVRIMKMLGISTLFVSNVSGSTNIDIKKGSLVVIDDHINMHYDNPLRGKNLDEMGPRFPDMSQPYSERLKSKAMEIAKDNAFVAHRGVYVSLPGPNLETKAEYLYLNKIGGDIVGMSTVPEVVVAIHCGIEVFAISVITDESMPIENLKPVTLDEVIAVAAEAEPKMTKVIKELIAYV